MLISLEGTDSSGKETQTKMLVSRLMEEGYMVKELHFPDYQSDASSLIRMYLGGKFGSNPSDVNPYAASMFYMVDRFASFKTLWEKDYLDPACIIITDRFSGSNAIHQAPKLPIDERKGFFKWLYQTEHVEMGVPYPDTTLLLDMPTAAAVKLMAQRANKFTHQQKKDIHEADAAYLSECHDNALCAADYYGWTRIACGAGEVPRDLDTIHRDIYAAISESLRRMGEFI